MTDYNISLTDSTFDHLYGLVTQLDDQHDGRCATTRPGMVSVVVPIRDERETIRALCVGIVEHIPAGQAFEIILIDDGSRDGSWEVMESLAREYPWQIRSIRLRHGAGKSTALTAGFQVARGEILVTMDADLQDDPAEIPRFLARLEEGYDLVSGWKRVRHDPWHKVMPSRIFNRLASYFGGVPLHDHNCGFKCYRAEVTRSLFLHGDMHRMIPSLAGAQGFRCGEMEVRHHPRRNGKSKYGWRRILRGFSDILTVGFLRGFRQRPAHWFNLIGCGYLLVGAVLAARVLARGWHMPDAAVWLLGTAIFAALGVATFLGGLLAELVIRGPLQIEDEIPIACDTGITLARRGIPLTGHDTAAEHGRPHTPLHAHGLVSLPAGRPAVTLAQSR